MKQVLCILVALATVFAAAAADRQSLAVLDFAKEGVSDQEMRSILSLLVSSLFRTKQYDVIDVAQRDALLKEIEFSASDCTDQSCQIEMGKMLSAEYIVVGSLGKVGSNWILSAKLLETDSARTASTADGVYKSLDALVNGIPNLVRQLTAVEGQAAAPRQRAQRAPVNLRPVFGVSLAAVGVGALGVGGYFLYTAYRQNSDVVIPARDEYLNRQVATEAEFAALYDTYVSAYRVFSGKLWPGIGMVAGGAAATGVGVALLLSGRSAAAAPEVSVILRPPHGSEPAALGFEFRRYLP